MPLNDKQKLILLGDLSETLELNSRNPSYWNKPLISPLKFNKKNKKHSSYSNNQNKVTTSNNIKVS